MGHAGSWATGMIAIVVLAVTYLSLYFVNVSPEFPLTQISGYQSAATPGYKLMHNASAIFFYPAYRLDANVFRPHVWEGRYLYTMSPAKPTTR